MAKRFTDTELDDRAWYRRLPPKIKCAWDFLCRQCDVVGVWNIDTEKLSFHVGEEVSLEEITAALGDKITLFEEDKLFIPGFVPFQYGDESGRLSPRNKFHLSVAAKLQARGFPQPEFKPFDALPDPIPMGIDTHTDGGGTPQGRGKGKGRGKDLGKGGVGENPMHPISAELIAQCAMDWQETCRRFRCDHPLTPTEQELIARACQVWGAKSVEFAIIGARFEPGGPNYDPSKNVSLQRILPLHLSVQDGREQKFERLRNIGIQAVRDGKALARLQDSLAQPTEAAS